MNFVNWIKAQGDRLVGWGGIAVGGVLILTGWIAISGTRTVSDQIPYLVSSGLGGLFFVVVGVALLVRADLHDEWSKLDAVEQALRSHGLSEEPVVELRDRPSAPARSVDMAGGARRAEPVRTMSLPSGNANAGTLAVRRNAPAAGMGLVGALLLLLGWVGVSGTRDVPDALNTSALAVAGLAVAAGAAGLHSFGLRRRVARRSTHLLGSLATTGPSTAGLGGRTAELDDGQLYVVDGSIRYHRSGCRVLTTQQASAVHPAATTAGLTACRLCEAPARDE